MNSLLIDVLQNWRVLFVLCLQAVGDTHGRKGVDKWVKFCASVQPSKNK